jgi:hypothetical protein
MQYTIIKKASIVAGMESNPFDLPSKKKLMIARP